MVGLLDMFQPATPDPLGRVLGASYDEGDQRWAGISQALGAASDAFLHPRQDGGGGWARAIGDIGGAMGKAGTAYGEGKTAYLHTAAKNEIAKREIERKKRLEDQEIAQDQAMADLVAGLSPEERAWAQANPEAWYKAAMEKKYDPTGGAGGKIEDFSTMPRTIFDKSLNGGKGGYRDVQIGDMGTIKAIDYGPGVDVPGPGEAGVRSKKFGEYADEKKAANTSVTNIAQASTAIEGLRQELETDPEWATGFGGYALKDIPTTKAQGIRDRLAQIDALSFFSSIGDMQGFGALSNIEGDRVAKAKSRVNQATDLPTMITALDDYERVIGEIFERNQRILASGNYDEMDRIRTENAKGLMFKKSRVPPFPGDGFGFTAEEWKAWSAQDKRDFYEAQKLVY